MFDRNTFNHCKLMIIELFVSDKNTCNLLIATKWAVPRLELVTYKLFDYKLYIYIYI